MVGVGHERIFRFLFDYKNPNIRLLTTGALSNDDVLDSDHLHVIVVIGGGEHAGGLVEEDHFHRLVVTRRATRLADLHTRALMKFLKLQFNEKNFFSFSTEEPSRC